MPIARDHGVSQQDASDRCPQDALQALMPITPFIGIRGLRPRSKHSTDITHHHDSSSTSTRHATVR